MKSRLEILKDLFIPPETPGSFFLSLEGIEGSGKSTQIKTIEDYLRNKGFRVQILREPGGTDFGEKLRDAILLSKTPLHPLAEAHLFCSSRAQLLNEKILPFLLVPNSVVILDRYIDSSLAYQGSARRLGLETVLELHSHHPLTLVPHRTYYLDISLATSQARQQKRGNAKDYFEAEETEFYNRLLDGYRSTASLFNTRIKRINAEVTEAEVTTQLLTDLAGMIS